MSNAITDKPGLDAGPPGDGPFKPVRETAPSVVAAEEPTWTRLVALFGVLLVAIGGLSLLIQRMGVQRGVPPLISGICLMLGLACLIYHAVRDDDMQVRRIYGLLGYVLLIAGVILSVWPVPAVGPGVIGVTEEAAKGTLFQPYGCACFIVALFFLLPFVRNETDESWTKLATAVIGTVGAAMALGGLVGSNFNTNFLLTYGGLPLILLGLAYLWAFLVIRGSTDDFSYRVGLAIGGIGLLVVVAALLHSFLPQLFYRWEWTKEKPQGSYFEGPGTVLMLVGLLYTSMAAGLCSDSRFIVLTRRELASFFYSPLAYIVIFFFAGVAAVHYGLFINAYTGRSGGSIQEPVVLYFMGYMLLVPVIAQILVVPLLTMRLLSEEQRSGTLEVLLTSPVNDGPVVLSKFAGVLIIYLMTWAPYGLFLMALRIEGGGAFDYRPLLSFTIALLCCGANYLGMGLFFSSLTRNQVVAGVMSAVGMLMMLATYFLKNAAQTNGYEAWATVLGYFSFVDLWLNALNGRLYLRDVIFQASWGVLWVYLTLKVLESRRWR